MGDNVPRGTMEVVKMALRRKSGSKSGAEGEEDMYGAVHKKMTPEGKKEAWYQQVKENIAKYSPKTTYGAESRKTGKPRR